MSNLITLLQQSSYELIKAQAVYDSVSAKEAERIQNLLWQKYRMQVLTNGDMVYELFEITVYVHTTYEALPTHFEATLHFVASENSKLTSYRKKVLKKLIEELNKSNSYFSPETSPPLQLYLRYDLKLDTIEAPNLDLTIKTT